MSKPHPPHSASPEPGPLSDISIELPQMDTVKDVLRQVVDGGTIDSADADHFAQRMSAGYGTESVRQFAGRIVGSIRTTPVTGVAGDPNGLRGFLSALTPQLTLLPADRSDNRFVQDPGSQLHEQLATTLEQLVIDGLSTGTENTLSR